MYYQSFYQHQQQPQWPPQQQQPQQQQWYQEQQQPQQQQWYPPQQQQQPEQGQQQDNYNYIEKSGYFQTNNLNQGLNHFSSERQSPTDLQLQCIQKKNQENQNTKVEKSSSFEICQICSIKNVKILFAFNGQVCEACKKFFERAIKHRKGKRLID